MNFTAYLVSFLLLASKPVNSASLRSLYRRDETATTGRKCATKHAPLNRTKLEQSRSGLRVAEMDLSEQPMMLIPVRFVVVRKGNGVGQLSDATLQKQLDVLNDGFSGALSAEAVDTRLRFSLNETIRMVNNDFYNSCDGDDESSPFQLQHARYVDEVINVFTCSGGGYLGWSSMPDSYPEQSHQHAIVLDATSVPGGSQTGYDEGKTLVHEAGHWLGLYHTFEEHWDEEDQDWTSGCFPGDFVDDTAAERTSHSGCTPGTDTCTGSPGDDPIENFMDYSDDVCMDRLTEGQAIRMREELFEYKPTGVIAWIKNWQDSPSPTPAPPSPAPAPPSPAPAPPSPAPAPPSPAPAPPSPAPAPPSPAPTPSSPAPTPPSPTPAPPAPTPTPPSPPTSQRCMDSIEGWQDSVGDSCDVYYESEWCANGKFDNSQTWRPWQFTGTDGLHAGEACCVCGGGTNSNICKDIPTGWVDTDGDDCVQYYSGGWCTKEGEYGENWFTVAGDSTFADFQNLGVSAREACCYCGGGSFPYVDGPTLEQPEVTTTGSTTSTSSSEEPTAAPECSSVCNRRGRRVLIELSRNGEP